MFTTSYSKRDEVYRDSESGQIITANARIDNRDTLYEKLGLTHDNGDLLPDNQLILLAYKKWGEDCPKYLLGDFVFVIRDEKRDEIFCARDHFGVKLLLISETAKGIMLSNEPNAFFLSGWVDKKLDASFLLEEIWGLDGAHSRIAYRHIEMLPASQLSEGLDSNAITGLAATLLPDQDIYTLSYQCVELTKDNESIWKATYTDIFEKLDMFDNLTPIWCAEQPNYLKEEMNSFIHNTAGMLVCSEFNLLHPSLIREKGPRVLLSGWGGDHCVTTYGDNYESELWRQGQLFKLFELLKDKHRRGRGRKPYKMLFALMVKHLLPEFYFNQLTKRKGLAGALLNRKKAHFMKPDIVTRYDLASKLERYIRNYQTNTVKGHHRRELFDIGVEWRLIQSELCARANKTEYRFPMLDVPLVEMAYNLPSNLKIKNGIERYHFRQMIEGLTTERNRWRMKADVAHPNIGNVVVDYHKIRDSVNTNAILQKYCDSCLIDENSETQRLMLSQLSQKLPYFDYYAELDDESSYTSSDFNSKTRVDSASST